MTLFGGSIAWKALDHRKCTVSLNPIGKDHKMLVRGKTREDQSIVIDRSEMTEAFVRIESNF